MTERDAGVTSMTGFARTSGGATASTTDGTAIAWTWTWELRSVNAKGLDVRVRLPSIADAWDAVVRERIGTRLARGSVTANWTLEADREQAQEVTVNERFLTTVLALQERLEAKGLVFPTAPSLDRLLAVRGVVEVVDHPADSDVVAGLQGAVLADLDKALEALVDTRRREGQRLQDVLVGHLDEISDLTERAAEVAATQPQYLKRRIAEQLELLLGASPPVSEERLAQELALLATKADVREETDRLRAHVLACRDLIGGGGPVGRKLDFLCQELNREANTLCSKATDLALTELGVDLKTRIERFREQIQNVE